MALTTIDDRGLKTPIDLLDNEKIRFGTGNDLQIYHESNEDKIFSTATKLEIRSPDLQLQNSGGEKYLVGTSDGSVELYYNHVKKFDTNSAGVKVHGICYFDDNNSARFGNGDDLQIYHDGSNSFIKDAGTGALWVYASNFNVASANGGESQLKCAEDGAVELYYNGSKKLETITSGVRISSGDLELLDNTGSTGRLLLGNGGDLQIYHDASDSWITDAGTGNLYLGSNGAGINLGKGDPSAFEAMIRCYTDGAVELYNDGTKKFETTSYGIKTAPFQQLGTSGTATANWHIGSENDGSFRFYNGNYGSGTEVLRAKYDGDISIANGNLVVAGGHGIDFSAQTATSVTGSATTSELLDHYEEGTWTPTLNAGTATWAFCKYIRVGRLVQLWGRMSAPTAGSATGIAIHDLPFTVNQSSASGSLMAKDLNATTSTTVYINTSHKLYFYGINSGNAWTSATWADCTANTEVYFQGNYLTD